MGWPDVAEFTSFLQASGLYGLTSATAAQAKLDLQGALDAAVNMWNDLTHFWPFMSTGNLSEERYLEQAPGSIIDLNGGLVGFSNLMTELHYDAAATESSLTSGFTPVLERDFHLAPRDARYRRKPWTWIQTDWVTTGPVPVRVMGEWGFCTEADLPSSARRAVMALAALELLPQIQRQIMQGGLKRLTRGDETKEWAALDSIGKDWQGLIDKALASGFTRIRIY